MFHLPAASADLRAAIVSTWIVLPPQTPHPQKQDPAAGDRPKKGRHQTCLLQPPFLFFTSSQQEAHQEMLEMNNNLPAFHHPSGSSIHKEHLTLHEENGSQPLTSSPQAASHFTNEDLESSRRGSAQTHPAAGGTKPTLNTQFANSMCQ